MQTILAVDYDEEHLARIENMLTGEFDVIAVNSLTMALKFLNQRIPQLILVGDGAEVEKNVSRQLNVELQKRKEWSSIPVESITNLLSKSALKTQVRNLIFNKMEEDEESLPVIRNGHIGEVPIDQIQYVEIYNQIRIVKTQYQELQTRMTTEYLTKRLGNRFLAIGDSLLVNKAFIREVVNGVLYMKDDRQLVLPRESRGELVSLIRTAMAVSN